MAEQVSIYITYPDQFMSVSFSHYYLLSLSQNGCPGSFPEARKISFLTGSNQVVRLEADDVVSKVDLSCTVANPGTFLWEWTRASDGAVSTSNVNLADLTRTSILTIDRLSMEDSGDYVCRAFHSNKSLALEATATIVLDLAYGESVLQKCCAHLHLRIIWGQILIKVCAFL